MESIPTHRRFITTLIDSLSRTPIPTPESNAQSSTTSPLHNASPSQRNVLLTLHVLFPNLLLPALDLLDRGLVARLQFNTGQENEQSGGGGGKAGEQKEVETEEVSRGNNDRTFLVKSLATTLSRRNIDAAMTSRRYLVHLGPWNCSCANFAFGAFPDGTTSTSLEHEASDDSREGTEGQEWSFGGSSLDGITFTGDVPCCKHLLACLLAERWPDVTGKCAKDRIVTKEELAGIISDL